MLSIRPRTTEKSYAQQALNTYIFVVPKAASKQSIAAEVAHQYSVSVVDVRIINRKGKPMRFSRGKNRYPGTTIRPDKKYAYVKLKAGDKIKVFDEEEVKDTNQAAETNQSTKVDKNQPTKGKKVGLLARRRTGVRGDK
jgi:ribosomal protein L23